jgi:hypothetical protein
VARPGPEYPPADQRGFTVAGPNLSLQALNRKGQLRSRELAIPALPYPHKRIGREALEDLPLERAP